MAELPKDTDVARGLREHDEAEFRETLNVVAINVEKLCQDLLTLINTGKNIPIMGVADHEALIAARAASVAVARVVIIVAAHIRMGVSND